MHKIAPSGHTGGTRQAQRTVAQEGACSVVLRKQQGGARNGGSRGQDRTPDLCGNVPDDLGRRGRKRKAAVRQSQPNAAQRGWTASVLPFDSSASG